MDPNPWNNFNQQAYGRLGAHSAGVPAAASSLNRFDLPMLDQTALGAGIGSSLSSPIAAHSALPQQRPLPGIPPVNYGHPVHSSMTQFLDSMHSLQPGFVGQGTYKSSGISPTAAPPSPYSLEASVRLHAEATGSLSRYTPASPSISHMGKPLLFNTDPHTMKETPTVTGFSSGISTPSPPVTDAPKNWQLSNFVPPPSNLFGDLSADVGSNPAGHTKKVSPEPPPAHTGARPSTIQRNPYQCSSRGEFVEPQSPLALARPAHSPHNQGSFIDSVLRETRAVGFTNPSPHPVQRSEPLAAHSSLPHSRSSMHHPFSTTTVTEQQSRGEIAYSPLPAMSNLSPFPSYAPLSTASYNINNTTSTPAYNSPQVVTSNLDSVNYDPVSPATPAADHQMTASNDSSSLNTVSLQDLADIGSHHGKVPPPQQLQRDHRSAIISVPVSPQHGVNMSSVTTSPHHAANMSSMTTSPQHRVGLSSGPDPMASHTPLQSPMHASPISVGSPQIPMSTGSPQQPVIGSSTAALPPPVPVQAVADSTTNKPKRKRGRKKGQGKLSSPPPPLLPIASAEPFPYTEPAVNVIPQQYEPSPVRMSTYDTPPSVNTYESSPAQQQGECTSYDAMNQVTQSANITSPYGQTSAVPEQAMVYDSPGLMMSAGTSQTAASTPAGSTPSMSTQSYDSPVAAPQMIGGTTMQEGYNSPVAAPQMMGSTTMQEGYNSPVRAPQLMSGSAVQEGYNSPVAAPHLIGGAAMQESYAAKASALGEDNVFMTNTFGNAFVSPNAVLEMENVLVEDPAIGARENPMTGVGVDEEEEASPETMTTPIKLKHKTKAEQKQMPLSVVCDDDIDDEFKHLLEEPVVPAPSAPKKRSPGRPPKVRPTVKTSPPAIVTPPVVSPKLQSPNSAFQSSFLSFLQGKVPETLSSVTNSSVTKKPQLPKYIPDPRPRATASSSSSAGSRKLLGKRLSQDEDRMSDSNSTADSKSIDIPSVPSTSQAFSDDEDISQNISKTVKNVISSLSEHGEDSKSDTSSTATTQPLTFQTAIPHTSAPSKRGRKSGRPAFKHKLSAGSRGRGRRKTVEELDSPVEEEDDKESSTDVASVQDNKDEDYIPDMTEDVPTPPPVRLASQRKAKTKTQEKRKKIEQKKKKQKRSSRREEEIESLSDASVSLSEGEEFIPISSEEERDYDSDKDPAWTPFAQVKHVSSDEEGKPKGRGRGRGRGRGSATKPGRGRGKRRGSGVLKTTPPVVEIEQSAVVSAAPPAEDNEDSDLVHNYQKGNFIIEKTDLARYDNFPIWKIDAGRLIQKFGATFKFGKLVHQALSTYSSWADSMRSQYKPIKTRVIPDSNVETVEVLEKYLPRPLQQDTSKIESDDLMQTFNVYMQILISQALEPGFIDAIKDSGENADYYLEPLNKIDSLIQEKLESMESQLNWQKDFRESVEGHHCMRISSTSDYGSHCQACDDKSVRAVKGVQLFGEEYNRQTLESKGTAEQQKYNIGALAAKQLPAYHTLKHFKFTLFKRCVAKSTLIRGGNSKLDNSTVVDKCLHNRNWVQTLFMELKRLLDTKETKT